MPIAPVTRDRLFGAYDVSNLGSFDILRDGDGLMLSLKPGVREPLYASAPDRFFILSSDLVLNVVEDTSPVNGRMVPGPFDVPFQKQR